MLSRLFQKISNAISEWLAPIQAVFQPAPIPVRIRSEQKQAQNTRRRHYKS